MRGNRAEGIRELLDEPIVIMTETSRKTKTGMGTKKNEDDADRDKPREIGNGAEGKSDWTNWK